MEEKSAAFFLGDFRACSVFAFFPFDVQTPFGGRDMALLAKQEAATR
jgi:hypothetical protein